MVRYVIVTWARLYKLNAKQKDLKCNYYSTCNIQCKKLTAYDSILSFLNIDYVIAALRGIVETLVCGSWKLLVFWTVSTRLPDRISVTVTRSTKTCIFISWV